jgi:exopolyphosphatase / guanosine-5'-triphosphate,3'-diphosphate pyrophosphatase
VIDIGGGSTEMIIGEGYEPQEMESLHIGCVSLSQRFFPDGRLSAKRVDRARLAARMEIEPAQARFLRRGWDKAYGSSGTVRAISESIRELDPQAPGITAEGLDRLIGVIAAADHTRDLNLEAVTDERRPVFPGGAVIMAEIFDALGIETLRVAEGALRDGLLRDMVGRLTDEDPRERTVVSMQRRYHVDLEQAGRVEATVLQFLSQVKDPWGLEDPLAELTLSWAARLHEIGLDVAHSGYHKHGAYLLQNADMPGFAREEQWLLSHVVGAHRRKVILGGVEDLIPPWDSLALYLIVLLRLSVLLHRGRSVTALPPVELSARGRTLELRFPGRWLREHPLTVADVQQEVEFLRPHGLRVRIYSGSRAAAA